MKRSSWSFAGTLVLASAIAFALAFALDTDQSVADGCGKLQSGSDELFVHGTSSGTRVVGDLPGTIVINLAATGTAAKKSYFSVDKRHRPAWWRSSGSARKGDKKRPLRRDGH
ncbi:hypothetical protein [uncultured Roseibium sp.]|uniref:hypothetical protein n=1 Tax=uncultured Roseibium sp. TaxID=1936171 RepID=UPI002621E2E9|nr:hypothetical protein [uncultured Roseibium sp.]